MKKVLSLIICMLAFVMSTYAKPTFFVGVTGGIPVTSNDNYGYTFDTSNGYLSSEVSYKSLEASITAISSNPSMPDAAKSATIAGIKKAQSDIKDWSTFKEDYKVGMVGGVEYEFNNHLTLGVPLNVVYSHFENEIGKCKDAGYKDDAKNEEIVQFVINPNLEVGYTFHINENVSICPIGIIGPYVCIDTLKSGEPDKTFVDCFLNASVGVKTTIFTHYTLECNYNFIDTSINASFRYTF